MNYINRLQSAQAFSISVGNGYFENQLMHIFLNNFYQGGKYTSEIAIHQAEIKRQEIFTNQKYLSITFLQTDYLNFDSSSGSGRNNEGANLCQTK